MTGQMGFWSIVDQLAKISAQGDPLETLAATVDFEMFRPVLEGALGRPPRWKGGRPAFDPVLKFRILVLQSLHGAVTPNLHPPEAGARRSDWRGCAMKVLQPLCERIEAEVMASDLLHADDTPIRVLDRSRRDRGLGKGVKKGRIWAYVRDQRPWAGTAPPGAVYRFAPDWKEEHVRTHLGQTSGILQADGYKGLCQALRPGPRRDCALPRGGVLGASAARLPRCLDRHQLGDRP